MTGTDSTVTAGWYPSIRTRWLARPVVAVTSVQPMSEKRTTRQDAGSPSARAANGRQANSARQPESSSRAALDLTDRLKNDRSAGHPLRTPFPPKPALVSQNSLCLTNC